MNAKRLLKLADFLDTVPREKFDFAQVAKEVGKPMRKALAAGKTRCGTVGCAMGWAPVVFPRLLKWVPAHKWHSSEFQTFAILPRDSRQESVGAGSTWVHTSVTAEAAFGLTEDQVQFLFNPLSSGLGDGATPKRVARHIRKFVRKQQRKQQRKAAA